jgi:hypothetical protein
MTDFLDIRPARPAAFGSRWVIAGRHPPIIALEGREVVNARFIFAALAALATGAAADRAGDLPSAPFPALAAAPLVYVLVPAPLGASTWAEREIEAARLGIGSVTREHGGAAADLLLSLHTARTPEKHALEMSEAPRDEPARAADVLPGVSLETAEDPRILGALEAMGLKPEDLVEAPEMPAAALAFVDFIARIDAVFRAKRPRERGTNIASLRVDPEVRHVKQPGYVKHKKPQEDPGPKTPNLTLYAKKVTRSLYKVLLGVAIGILIWGFVRDSA